MNTKNILSKVPEATVIFWITKVLTTGMGETASDYFVTHLVPAVAVALGAIGLIVVLLLQFSTKRYVPWVYWLTVVMVSVFGTMAADILHVGLGIPYIVSTIFFIVVLSLIFIIWYSTEKTLSIHSITTRRREVFYWLTILTTFALGTATGDLTATTLHLGYLASGILFAIAIAIPAVLYAVFKLNEIFTFWFAYILTRPLGASFSDWMAVSHARGGLAWGSGSVTFALTILIVLFVGYLTLSDSPSS